MVNPTPQSSHKYPHTTTTTAKSSSHLHIPTSPDQIPNPVGALPDDAIKSLYLHGSQDPLHGLSQDQEHNIFVTLFCWRAPVLTVLSLVCIHIIAILITFFNFNFVTLVCYILLIQILMSLVYIRLTKLYLNFQGATPSIHEITQYDGPYYDKEDVRVSVEFICSYIYLLLDQLIFIYRGINSTKSIATIIILFTIAQLARLIPFALFLAWVVTGVAVVMLFRTNPRFTIQWYSFMLSIFGVDPDCPQPHIPADIIKQKRRQLELQHQQQLFQQQLYHQRRYQQQEQQLFQRQQQQQFQQEQDPAFFQTNGGNPQPLFQSPAPYAPGGAPPFALDGGIIGASPVSIPGSVNVLLPQQSQQFSGQQQTPVGNQAVGPVSTQPLYTHVAAPQTSAPSNRQHNLNNTLTPVPLAAGKGPTIPGTASKGPQNPSGF